MRYEIIVDNWQDVWDWCHNNLSAEQWDMLQEDSYVFSIDEEVHQKFLDYLDE